MATVFATLFDLAAGIMSAPDLASLTRHKGKSRDEAEALLRASIVETVMPGEAVGTRWQRARIFCLNYVNRAQAAVTAEDMRALLDEIQTRYASDSDRLAALGSLPANQLRGPRPQEFIAAISQILSPQPIAQLGGQSYFDWLDQRWTYWANQNVQDLDAQELLSDAQILSREGETKIKGMALPLAANFFADMGLAGFVKPDLHVTPIISLLRLMLERGEDELEAVFLAGIEIAKQEDLALRHDRRFGWLQDHGGLWPRYLDRLIYLIGSDNFALTGDKYKLAAPKRRALMRQALIEARLVGGHYS